jgi:DMSO/TMAO reductase YedYZ molybdopterin-dependent catalytic subunit
VIAGILLTVTLTAVSFAGWKLAGLPFAPFDIFDWIVRLLPGAVVTAAIETSVALGRTFGVTNISTAAKAGDQALAIAMLLVVGGVSGAVLFQLLALTREPALLFGGILGAVIGGLALIAERQLLRLPPGSIVPGLWVFATFLAWGVAFGWVHDRLKLSTTEDTEDTEGRRTFLRTMAVASVAASAIATIAGVAANRVGQRLLGRRWSDDHPLPNAGADVVPLDGTRVEFTPLESFYRIDTDTRAPALDASRWRLAVGGLVDRPLSFTLEQLRAIEPTDVFATLCCISNPPGGDLIGTTRWTGVSLRRLLPQLGLQPSVTHLKVASADGFFESIALDTVRADERVLLVYAWDGVPLPVEHGYPLRLFVPNVYGMKQPKWILSLDATGRWEPGYWVTRGWSRDGRVSTTSAIDVATISRRDAVTIEAGGIAFGGARGISSVDVRVDEGEWHAAKLRRPLSDLTWVIWRAEVPVGAGPHRVTVRAFDGAGDPQQASFHSRRVTA